MQRTLLIVDDEYAARKMLRMLLEPLKEYTIIGEATNGQKALELYHQLNPDIVITDIEMPIMNGLELTAAIREQNSRQIIIILSCYESFQYAQKAIQLRVQDYLIKDMVTRAGLQECLDTASKSLKDRQQQPLNSINSDINRISEIHGVSEDYAALLEKDIERLSVDFFSHDKERTLEGIQRLYRTHLSGMTQYCFLQQVTRIVVSWIINECIHYELSSEEILSGATSPLSYLEYVEGQDTACMLICHWVSNLMDSIVEVSQESPRTRQIITYLNENYHKDLSLQLIADHFHIHKVYLSRSFKEETGMNLNTYLNYLRIENAKLLLCLGTYHVNEIAFMVGFHNTQNFYNTFRKLTGCAPTDYLNNKRSN